MKDKYFNKKKTGIGYHGDTERRKVIAWRLGEGDYGDPRATMPIHWQWYINSKPVGQNMKFNDLLSTFTYVIRRNFVTI